MNKILIIAYVLGMVGVCRAEESLINSELYDSNTNIMWDVDQTPIHIFGSGTVPNTEILTIENYRPPLLNDKYDIVLTDQSGKEHTFTWEKGGKAITIEIKDKSKDAGRPNIPSQ